MYNYFLSMATIKLKKGYDLNLEGEIANESVKQANAPQQCAIVPDDFNGITPRLDKKEGETVAAGEVVYHDKTHDSIKVVSPVGGTIKAINRGNRRKIESIVIECDTNGKVREFDVKTSPKELLLESGLWAMLRQRPYDVVPSPEVKPRDIFVTCFDSAPLAPSFKIVLGDDEQYINKGVEMLSKLTDGNVYLGCNPTHVIEASGAITNVFEGPHPAGNAGVQIANIKPVNKGEVVWTLNVITLAKIGKLFATGKVDFSTTVGITGSEVVKPEYIKTIAGVPMSDLVRGNINENGKAKRYISGNVLTGKQVTTDGYLRAPYCQLTVIPEVEKEDEFMGWASLSPKKFSVYRDFTSWIFGNKKPVKMDAKINGGERAIVMSGEYDRMLPMDIYSEFLIKAIIAFNIDKMEQLGIYEVAPEDFALAEYADTSKLELQRIVREGLDKMRKEVE